jgi:hypothetical protein
MMIMCTDGTQIKFQAVLTTWVSLQSTSQIVVQPIESLISASKAFMYTKRVALLLPACDQQITRDIWM